MESGDHATGHNAEAANEAAPDAGMSSTVQAGPAVPSLGPPGPATPGMEVGSNKLKVLKVSRTLSAQGCQRCVLVKICFHMLT